jgi:hypothetical protein
MESYSRGRICSLFATAGKLPSVTSKLKTEIEKAGLTNGKLYGIQASFGDDSGATPPASTFSLVAQGDNGEATGGPLRARAGRGKGDRALEPHRAPDCFSKSRLST